MAGPAGRPLRPVPHRHQEHQGQRCAGGGAAHRWERVGASSEGRGCIQLLLGKGPQAAAGWGWWGMLHVSIAARHVRWQQYATKACATFPDQGRFAKAPDTWSMQVVAPCVWWCCCWMHSPSCRWSCCPCRRLPLRPCARIQLRHDALPALAGHTLRRLNPTCAACCGPCLPVTRGRTYTASLRVAVPRDM